MRYLIPIILALALWNVPVRAGDEPTAEPAAVAAPVETPAAAAPVTAPAPEAAAEAPAETAPKAESEKALPKWLQYLVGILGTLITMFLVPFLKRKAASAKAEAEKNSAEATQAHVNARGILVSRLQEFLWGSAEAIAEKKFPALAQKIANGDLNSAQGIKKELYGWGGDLRGDAIAYFNNQGVDIIAAVGDDFLDKLIERAANKVSPFPGRDTAKELLQAHATDWLIAQGVEWVRRKYEHSAATGQAPNGDPA